MAHFQDNNSDNSSNSDNESQEEQKRVDNRRMLANELFDSSSDEDVKRVVLSEKDKRYMKLKETIANLKQNVERQNFANVDDLFDTLLKDYEKSKKIIDENGIPSFFIRAIYRLEDKIKNFTTEEKKKLSQANSKAMNAIHRKITKIQSDIKEGLKKFAENPTVTTDEGSGEEKTDSDFKSDSSNDSIHPLESNDPMVRRQFWLLKKKKDSESEDEEKGNKDDDKEINPKVQKVHEFKVAEVETERQIQIDLTYEGRTNILNEFVAKRTQKDFDQKYCYQVLKAYLLHYLNQEDQAPHVEIITELIMILIPITVDYSQKLWSTLHSSPSCMSRDMWLETYTNIQELLKILQKPENRTKQYQHYNKQDDNKFYSQQKISESISTFFNTVVTELNKAFYSTETQSEEQYNRIQDLYDLLRLSEKVQHFYYELLNENVQDFNEQLNKIKKDVQLNEKVQHFYEQLNTTALTAKETKSELQQQKRIQDLDNLLRLCENLQQLNLNDQQNEKLQNFYQQLNEKIQFFHRQIKQNISITTRIAFLRLENMYYIHDSILAKVRESDKQIYENGSYFDKQQDTESIIHYLATLIYKYDQSNTTKAILYHIYHHAIHDRTQVARDYLLMSKITDNVNNIDSTLQIFYNRVLAQLGLAYFRQGNFTEAFIFLNDLCSYSTKIKELIGQSHLRYSSQSDKRKVLPQHQHINVEMIEIVNFICSMLIEAPIMVQETHSKNVQARNYRRLLDSYSKSHYISPPEQNRDLIYYATKELQKGSWKACYDYLTKMTVWRYMTNLQQTLENLMLRIKEQSFKSYLFQFKNTFDNLNLNNLVEKFQLDAQSIKSTTFKMVSAQEINARIHTIENQLYIIFEHSDRTSLQGLSNKLIETVNQSQIHNQRILDKKIGTIESQQQSEDQNENAQKQQQKADGKITKKKLNLVTNKARPNKRKY
ncbi:hypothetical protein ABPG72_013727 [Tetrahymena utriculariae]